MIEKYLWRTVLPYFFLVWILLTAILLLQQSSRYADLIFGAQISGDLLRDLFLALLPNILAFTSPIAILTAIMIGFGQLQGDSELIAMRAAGVGTVRLIAPALLLGVLLAALTFYINLHGVPESARMVRGVAARAALARLESPLEPGVFNTDIPNHLIYAREGNREKGVWEKVFIYTPQKKGVRLVTASAGRIDASQEQSELVLEDAVVTTLDGASEEVAVERVARLRVALETGRRELLKRLQAVAATPEELGLDELSEYAAGKSGKERADALVLWHRRAALAVAPIVFAWLGIGLSLRFSRGGRGWNVVLALGCSVFYYLFSLFAEQTARAGTVPPIAGGWIPTVSAVLIGLILIKRAGRGAGSRWRLRNFVELFSSFERTPKSPRKEKIIVKPVRLGFFGLLERDVFRELIGFFAVSVAALLFLYLIFTAFESWRFAAASAGGLLLLGKYLLFLSPAVFFQIAPSAFLLAILATYALKAKRLETTAWAAAGLDVVRLLVPALGFAALLGWASWELQERVLPETNQRQDVLRAQLRGGGSVGSKEGRFWFSAPDRIYSFVAAPSDNHDNSVLREVRIFEFADDLVHLQSLKQAGQAEIRDGLLDAQPGEQIVWRNSFVEVRKNDFAPQPVETEIADAISQLDQSGGKFSQLNSLETEKKLETTAVVSEQRRLRVSLQRKRSVIVVPLIVALFAAPFAFAFGRRGAASPTRPLIYAFGIWLLFIGANTVFEQSANAGFLPAALAVWAPILILSSLGIYLLAKTQN